MTTEINSNSDKCKGITPKLKKRQANHTKTFLNSTNNLVPHYPLITQFGSYSYLIFGKVVIDGYFRQIVEFDLHMIVPADIAALCKQFAFVHEDGIHQLGHEMCCILQKIHINKGYGLRITVKLIRTIIRKILTKGSNSKISEKQIQFYLIQLFGKVESQRIAITTSNYLFY